VSYAELADRIQALAAAYETPPRLVVIEMGADQESVAAYLAALYFARSLHQKIAVSAIALVMFPMADPPIYNFLQIKLPVALSACTLLLWLPRIPLPKRAVMPILVLGAASYHIYLVHNLLPHFLFVDIAVPRWTEVAINFGSGVLLGLVVYGLQRGLVRFARHWRTAHPTRVLLSQAPAE
jgi:surface polysaccharide O-acyltransferase-like enzyme